jgi:hypothetical protein
MEIVIGTLGAIAGVAVAVSLFVLAWRVVVKARKGNAKLREASKDPHRSVFRNPDDAADPFRDIPQ